MKPSQSESADENPSMGGIGFYSYSYLYAPNSGRNSNFFSLTGFYQGQQSGDLLEVKGNFEGVAIVKPATTWTIEAPEAYVGTSAKLSDVVSVRAGRELKHWSHLDEDFQLGIWQPRFQWDYVHPQTVGLTGLFVDVKTQGFQLTAFASPVFVPDRGIPVEVRDNQIYKIDPYFNSPASSIPFRGVSTPVSYAIAEPSIGEVIAHPGGSIMARVGDEQGPWASAAYGFQPINQLLFSFSGSFDIGQTQNQTIDATLYPRVAYHQMTSTEAGYEGGWYGFSISELEDRPIDDAQILGTTSQVITPSHAISPAVEMRFGDLKYNPTRIRIAGLRQWGGNAPDTGQYATGTTSVFDSRYFSQVAVMASAEAPLDFVTPHLSGRYRLVADVQHVGTIQSSDLIYIFDRSFMVNLGGDFLNSNEDPSARDPISEFRADDRIRFGVSYVF